MTNVFDQFDGQNVFDQFDAPVTVVPKGGEPRQPRPEEVDDNRIMQAGTGELLLETLGNVPGSAKQFGSDLIAPLQDPKGTVKALVGTAVGGAQKLFPGEQSQEPQFDAVVNFFVDRYGGIENIKKTAVQDPVGFLGDIALVLSGTGAAIRAPGAAVRATGATTRAASQSVTKVADTVSKVGRVVDPINQVLQTGKVAGKGAGKVVSEILGRTTGVSGKPIQTAARAGFIGGETAKALSDSMRGNVPVSRVVDKAQAAVNKLVEDRGRAYRAGMGDIKPDSTVLDFAPISRALKATEDIKKFKGQDLSPSTKKIRADLKKVVDKWENLDASEFHTVAGFDALKQTVDDIRKSTAPGSPERVVANRVFGEIRDQIVKQSPDYAKVMDDYTKASDLIKEMQKTLSVNDRATFDTTLRKLQSVMRNNVSTNFGQRVALVEVLKQHGAVNILEELAGQALSSGSARGLAGMVQGATAAAGGGGLAASLAGFMNPALAASVLGGLALQSPRLIGEAALATGKAARQVSKVPARGIGQALFQSRALDTQQDRSQGRTQSPR